MSAQQQPQPANGQPNKGPRMGLANIVRGRLQRSMRVFVYGVDKIGKSTFGAGAPSPIFLGAEDGTSELDVARFAEPRTLRDMLDALDALATDQHDFKSIILDTLDWAEPMIWAATCERGDEKGKKFRSIEGWGYGKGYTEALTEWRALLTRLDRLRIQRRMHVVLLAHAWVKEFKNPQGDNYDRYEPKIHAKASGLVKEWADCIMFAQHETGTVMKGDGPLAKARGVSSGARFLYTQRTAAYDAGNRYGLPPKLPLDWQSFEEAVRAGTPEDPKKLKALFDALLAQVDPTTRANAEAWFAKDDNGSNPVKLAQAVDKLRGKITIIQENNEDSKEENQAQ